MVWRLQGPDIKWRNTTKKELCRRGTPTRFVSTAKTTMAAGRRWVPLLAAKASARLCGRIQGSNMVGPANSNEATELQKFFKQTVMKETAGKWISFPGGCSSYWLPFSDQVDFHSCDIKLFCFSLSKSWNIDFVLSCNSSLKIHNVWEHEDRTLVDRERDYTIHFITILLECAWF